MFRPEKPVYAWPEKGLAYVPIPKAACTSVKYALFQARGIALDSWNVHEATWPDLMTMSEADRACQVIFTVVRNPIDRLYSCWASKFNPEHIGELQWAHPQLRPDMWFQEFVRHIAGVPDEQSNEHIASQTFLLKDAPRRLIVLKVEQLAVDWLLFCAALNLPQVPLEFLNANGHSKSMDVVPCYDDIRQRYSADFERFGYEYEVWAA